jgi:hypothetical protein
MRKATWIAQAILGNLFQHIVVIGFAQLSLPRLLEGVDVLTHISRPIPTLLVLLEEMVKRCGHLSIAE